jgi:hypothetical protein
MAFHNRVPGVGDVVRGVTSKEAPRPGVDCGDVDREVEPLAECGARNGPRRKDGSGGGERCEVEDVERVASRDRRARSWCSEVAGKV